VQTPPNSCTAELLLRTSCASVCRGAMIMLGVVSGSAECQTCVANGCR
jgi:hypothetical protein